jgi:hypothetical protein
MSDDNRVDLFVVQYRDRRGDKDRPWQTVTHFHGSVARAESERSLAEDVWGKEARIIRVLGYSLP